MDQLPCLAEAAASSWGPQYADVVVDSHLRSDRSRGSNVPTCIALLSSFRIDEGDAGPGLPSKVDETNRVL